MIRLSLIFFVVFSSNIFCVQIRVLHGLFAGGKTIMLSYSPNYSKYQQAHNDNKSACDALDDEYKKGKYSHEEYKNKKKELDYNCQRIVYGFNFPSTGAIKVSDLLDFFLKMYNDGKTSRGNVGLVVPSSSGLDIKNYEFERLNVIRNDRGTSIQYDNIDDVVDVRDDCVIAIKFAQKPKGPSGPGGSDGKKSSGGCSCKNGKN